MDYENEYKAALERAKNLHKDAIDMCDSLRTKMAEIIFPELKESEDEKTKRILHSISSKMSFHLRDIFTEEEFQCFDAWSNAWLKKQGEQKTDEWEEGNIIRHGGILARVIEGRKAMKSNGEIFTVQYPDEWVKAVPNEIEHFFNEFEKKKEQYKQSK